MRLGYGCPDRRDLVYLVVRRLPVPVVHHQVRDHEALERLRVDEVVLVPRPITHNVPGRQIRPEASRRLGPGRDRRSSSMTRRSRWQAGGSQSPTAAAKRATSGCASGPSLTDQVDDPRRHGRRNQGCSRDRSSATNSKGVRRAWRQRAARRRRERGRAARDR